MKLTKDNFAQSAQALGYRVWPEFTFLPDRKFRADWLVIAGENKVLIEYEGIYINHTGASRHTTRKGYSKDCEKYNLASMAGYIVLRYTALNFENVFKDLEIIKKGELKC